MINGLQLLADNSSSPIYQLTTTYRFGQRSADYTGLFYNGSLVAKQSNHYTDLPTLNKILSEEGGPTLILTDLPSGDCTPKSGMMLAAIIVASIFADKKSKEVAVLTCMKDTTRSLQKTIMQYVGFHENILIDTVARVQGLTTDVIVFFVPNTSYIRTLEPHLFNVATSRAKEHTIIIADKNVLEYPTLKPTVRCYLEKLKNDKCTYISSDVETYKQFEQKFYLE
jgi:hypothetical protein